MISTQFTSVIFLASFLILTRSAVAKPIGFGHNLTATTHVLDEAEATIGLQSTGIGFSDRLSVAISSWLILDYNMYNLFSRYQFYRSEDHTEALQLAIFKKRNF